MAALGRDALIAKLQLRREAILAELLAGPGQSFTLSDNTVCTAWKPDYSVDGEAAQWNEYKKGLYTELDDVEALIRQYSSPFVVRSRGMA